MSRTCILTNKGPVSGNRRSHSLRATRRRWNVNLQKVTLYIDGHKVPVRISAKGLRSYRKANRVETAE